MPMPPVEVEVEVATGGLAMKHEYTLWVVVMAISLHILEEYGLNFIGWSEIGVGANLSWEIFHLVNASLIIFAIAGAMIGWRVPELSLIMPVAIAINAIFVHLLLTLVMWRFSPGIVTGTLLFIPAASWAFYGAYRDGVLTRRAVVVSVLGGVLITLYLAALLMVRIHYGPQFIFPGHG